MKLSVVIVNYNVKYFLEQCLRSLLLATQDISTEIFVIDNASTDYSLDYLSPLFPQVNFIANKENVGFARANNQAIRLSKGEYVLLLNPDTVVSENSIKECIKLMDTSPRIGGCGVQMLNFDGTFAYESRRGFPSPLTSFYKMTGLCKLFPYFRHFGKYYLRYLDKKQINKIDVISGAFMFLKKEALYRSGLLDENFFMYGEDIDLSYRITQAGYLNYYVPAPILHYKGESTKKDSLQYVHTFYEAMVIFFQKHYPHYNIFFSFLIKTAIYGHAFFAIGKSTKKKIEKKWKHKGRKNPFRFLVLGNERTIQDMRHLCKINQLEEEHSYVLANEISCPEGHLIRQKELSTYTHIIYDNEMFSYSTILKLFALHPQKGVGIGIYSPLSHLLILPQHIYQG